MAESSSSSRTETRIRENCTAIDGLRHSQTNTAHFLHLSFLAASDHPDIAKVIRLTAHSAQIQHSLALDCMVKFSSNSEHVVDTLLPMIIEGIEYEMPELITSAFDEIMNIADQMYNEAVETVKRYEEIQIQVQGMMSRIETKHVELKEFLDKLQVDKRAAEAQVELAGEKVDTQTTAAARYTGEYDRLCREKKCVFGEYSKALDSERNNDGSSDVFTNMLFPTMAVGGIVAAGVVGVFCPPLALATVPFATAGLAAVSFGVNVWNEDRKTMDKHFHTNRVVAQMDKTETQIQSALDKQRQEELCIIEYKKEQMAAVHEVERLAMAAENTADVSGLINASKGLGQVYVQLLRIKEFWGQMVVCIDLINKDTRAASMYKARSDLLRQKVQQSEGNWKTFVVVCNKYVKVCKHDEYESVRNLYTFLSEPVESMTNAQRRERQADIADRLTRRIQGLGNA